MSTREHFFYKEILSMRKTAILIDGAFFLKRYRAIMKIPLLDPEKTANYLHFMCLQHLKQKEGMYDLHRIYYYDALPYKDKQTNPISKKTVDFKKHPQYLFRNEFFEKLKKKRKVALRLGVLETKRKWIINESVVKDLLAGKKKLEELQESDVTFDLAQKGVDMMIGVDIATLAFKKQVDQIILISGDSDFVPAAKLARIEGIDFILDPMWNNIKTKLHEHIDGLLSQIENPKRSS